jgi:hypothetical protein
VIKAWAAIGTLLGLIAFAFSAFLFLDDRHLAAGEKDTILVIVAQSAKAMQADIVSIRIQQLQWELDDIVAREKSGNSLPGDAARKIVVTERLKDLAKK